MLSFHIQNNEKVCHCPKTWGAYSLKHFLSQKPTMRGEKKRSPYKYSPGLSSQEQKAPWSLPRSSHSSHQSRSQSLYESPTVFFFFHNHSFPLLRSLPPVPGEKKKKAGYSFFSCKVISAAHSLSPPASVSKGNKVLIIYFFFLFFLLRKNNIPPTLWVV